METELRITLEDPTSLILDPQNVRDHNDRNRQTINASLGEFGMRKVAISVWEKNRTVYAGNALVTEAIQRGYSKVPVAWIPEDWTEAQCKAYGIADNRSSDLSTFDDERLKEALRTLSEVPEIDIDSVGFTQAEVDALLASVDDLQSADDFPEVGDDLETEHECPKCGYRWSGKPN